ncbi:Mur ligase family protein [Wolbachia endosymbiont of Pentidionis agamae]|uniref:Mur ligase family protein n=1 Tax=Wolbachia endosymbiont of Pentidionis agamae TaxID=3110435 RepID=UPI002FCF84EB
MFHTIRKAFVFHPNPQKIYTDIVSTFHRFRCPKYSAAVTGTNGKTSVVDFCYQMWQHAGYKAASVGTFGIHINTERKICSDILTTPDQCELYPALRKINKESIEHLVLEASSHGLAQHRIHGLKVNIAAFTNLSSEHLDYHKNINKYFEAKKRLFCEILSEEGVAILNTHTDEFSVLFDIAKKRGNKIITYGKKNSNITLLKQTPTQNGQYLIIKIYNRILNVFFPVLGKFQAYNLLCAIGIIISSGVSYKEICINKLISPPGRMERVNSFTFIDYAHSAEALRQVLLSLKWHFRKRIILVFGCGGNRDKYKRYEMGNVAQKYADKVIITDDNPRNEDPAKIRNNILLNCPTALEIGCRKKAIEGGIDIAYNEGMILLIAGKGHEVTQIIRNNTYKFSDTEIAMNYLKKLNNYNL